MNQTGTLFKGIDTVVLWVQNLERARIWYLDKLGLEARHIDEAEGLAVLDTGGEGSITLRELKLGEKKPAPDSPTTFPVLFVEDPESFHKRLKAFPDSVKDPGVKVGAIQSHQGRILCFELWDLDQNRLQVHSHRSPEIGRPGPGSGPPGLGEREISDISTGSF